LPRQESELKFIFAPDDLPKIKALPLLRDALAQASHQRLVSTYFDTPDNYLWEHGMSLRVRLERARPGPDAEATNALAIRSWGSEGQPEAAQYRCT
jgi:hypothetical protein